MPGPTPPTVSVTALQTMQENGHVHLLTLVKTMYGLCALAVLTVWKMSTAPSNLTLSISDIQVMKTPVRDMPSLRVGGSSEEANAQMILKRGRSKLKE